MDVKTLAVDGDIIAYRTAAVCEEHFEGAVKAIIDTTLRDIATDTGISNMRIYLSGEKNYRYDVAKTLPYKGNRATMVRPQFLPAARDYLVEKYGAIIVDGFEADDGIATDMTITGAAHCGIDKDLLQIEGLHYNYIKKEWTIVGAEEAEITLYRQILMGDKSDNVPGLPGIGEKKAANVIVNAKTAFEDALEFYRDICEAKLPDISYIEYFSEQSNLITMQKDVPIYQIDFDISTFVEAKTEGFEPQEGEIFNSETKVLNIRI